MRWEQLFDPTICERGKAYYESQRVMDLVQSGNVYKAKVRGDRVYAVRVDLKSKKRPVMSCACPYAKKGSLCKHMAAVLFAIDDEMSEREKFNENSGRAYPFSRTSDEGEYRYFDMGRITSKLCVTKTILAEARKLVESGAVTLEMVEVGYPDRFYSDELVCYARGMYKKGSTQAAISARFDKNGLLESYCQAPRCPMGYVARYWGEKEIRPCAHMVAFLLLLDGHMQEHDVYDSTDYNALKMMSSYRSSIASETSEKLGMRRVVSLEPRLEVEGDAISASFLIGEGKMYVVRNLSGLVDIVEGKGSLSLGKKETLDFGACVFSEKGQRYYDYIRRIVAEERHHTYSFRGYRLNSEDVKGSIQLYGGRLDDFFEMACGGTVPCVDRSAGGKEKKDLQLRKWRPNIALAIQKDLDDEGRFQGVSVEGVVPRMIEGAAARYYVEDGFLNQVDQDVLREISPVLDLAKGNRVKFRVGRRHLSEFYYRILPILQECAKIEEKDAEEIEKFLPPEVAFRFYMDAEDGRVSCRPCAVYGEASFPLTDWRIEGRRQEEFREESRETDALDCVLKYFGEVDEAAGICRSGDGTDEIYRILDEGIPELMRFGEVQGTPSFRGLRIRRRLKVSVGVSVKGGLLDLQVASEDLTPKELLDILSSYKKKKKYCRLRSGDFLSLSDDSLGELSAMLDTMHMSAKDFVKGKMKVPMYRALYLDKMLEGSREIYARRDSAFRNLVRSFKTVDDSDFELPESLAGTMRGYQVYGFKWLKTLEGCGFGGILADDMGLGKTLQVISVLLAAKLDAGKPGKAGADGAISESQWADGARFGMAGPNGEREPALVVCPASLVYNWREECGRFAPELNVCAVAGSSAERKERIERYREYDVLVTSYDLLKRDIAEYEGKQFSYEVIDEAQYIKNHTTAAAKSVKLIQSRHRFALTGTPIENRLSELWSIFDYLMPGFLYGYDVFRKEMETPIVKSGNEEAMKRLKRMVSPFILRRRKSDVLKDLPDKMEEVRYAKFSEAQQRLYDGQVVHMREILDGKSEESFQKSKLQVLAELTKLRQICCDPALLFEDYKGESAKRESCIELIHSAIEGEHKILLFSQFTSMLELLEEDLKAEGIAYYKITGATPKEKRTQMVRSFNGDDTPLFLISLKAGGTGLNLTGADIVIHYDPWWNLAVQNQATDRAHRIGQTKVVSVYRLIAMGTVEEKILQMQERKKDLADEILSGDLGGIMNMSKEELMELIG